MLFHFWMARSDDNVTTCVPPSLTIPNTITSHAPQIVIAHRGASAHLPEHTLPAYRLALELGADYIEPDLVATKDNQLIAIHSMDLNITTNVAELFPDRAIFSKYLDRTGYWSYNFDLDELKTLKVSQRLPAARTTAFDGLFEIPTFTEVMGVIQMWNAQVNPLLVNSTNGIRSKPGIYLELKDFPWLKEDTGVDLNDLFFQHIQDNEDLWENVVFDRLCDTQKLKIHEFRLPPLVVQSFEATVLEDFTKRWQDTYIEEGTPSGTTTKPVPPTVLLVGLDKCMEEAFWFNVGEYRGFLKGLGPGQFVIRRCISRSCSLALLCILHLSSHFYPCFLFVDKMCLYHPEWRQFMERATEFDLVVHPWTERPELEYVGGGTSTSQFDTVLDEMLYFLCTVKVQGLFSESVQVAVMASNMGCDEEDPAAGATEPPQQDDTKDTSTKGSTQCYETDEEANIYIGLAAFVMGGFVSALASLWFGRSHRRRGRRQMTVPTVEIEMTDDDNEML